MQVRRMTALLLAGMVLAAQTSTGPIASYTATTDNVSGAPESIRIDVLRWSTEAEREQLLGAWSLTAPPAGGGRGKGGRGKAAPDPAPDPAAVDNDSQAPARGAKGGKAGKGGKGGKGAGSAPAAPQTPESSLTAWLSTAPIVGRLWSSEVAGYALRSAIRISEPDGSERIILISDRRLGAWNDLWKPAGSDAPNNYAFSVIELRLNSKSEGEGKTSLTGKVAIDGAAKAIALENYGVLPLILKNVKRKGA